MRNCYKHLYFRLSQKASTFNNENSKFLHYKNVLVFFKKFGFTDVYQIDSRSRGFQFPSGETALGSEEPNPGLNTIKLFRFKNNVASHAAESKNDDCH